MNQSLRNILVKLRNRWSFSNTIKQSRDSSVEISGNLIATKVFIEGSSELYVGKGCRLRNALIQARGKNNKIVLSENVFFSGKIEVIGDDNEIRIGENTRINGADLYAHNGTEISIGLNCLFSTRIDIRTTDSHPIFDSDGNRINPDRDVHIGNCVWIGRGASILKGSEIGDGSVIGSMSLVSGDIPNRVIAAGVPAKPIRNDITWKF
ncbi:MAG: acyltransferase [Verrucomicrobiota bacterium]